MAVLIVAAAIHREAAGHKDWAYIPRMVRHTQEDHRSRQKREEAGVHTLPVVAVESCCNPYMKDEVEEVRPIDLVSALVDPTASLEEAVRVGPTVSLEKGVVEENLSNPKRSPVAAVVTLHGEYCDSSRVAAGHRLGE